MTPQSNTLESPVMDDEAVGNEAVGNEVVAGSMAAASVEVTDGSPPGEAKSKLFPSANPAFSKGCVGPLGHPAILSFSAPLAK